MNLSELDTSVIGCNIRSHHELYDFPIKDITAEGLVVNFLEHNSFQVGWEAGSHKQGSDVFVYLPSEGWLKRGWSVKSAKEPQNGDWFQISSYRTGKYKTGLEKVEAIRKIEDCIDGYIIFARTESKAENVVKTLYRVYLIDREVLDIGSFNIEGPNDKGDFKGLNDLGVKMSIVKSMSSQVWYNVPMQMIKEEKLIKKLYESEVFDLKLRPIG